MKFLIVSFRHRPSSRQLTSSRSRLIEKCNFAVSSWALVSPITKTKQEFITNATLQPQQCSTTKFHRSEKLEGRRGELVSKRENVEREKSSIDWFESVWNAWVHSNEWMWNTWRSCDVHTSRHEIGTGFELIVMSSGAHAATRCDLIASRLSGYFAFRRIIEL